MLSAGELVIGPSLCPEDLFRQEIQDELALDGGKPFQHVVEETIFPEGDMAYWRAGRGRSRPSFPNVQECQI